MNSVTALPLPPQPAGRFAPGGHPVTHEDEMVWAARRAAVSMAAAAIRACDDATGDHSDDVMYLCDGIADVLEIQGDDRFELLAAAQLHDIGKIGLPKEMLLKRGPLDDGEWALIRQHTLTGAEMVQAVPELSGIAPLVRHSHERWDGRGYPDGLAGEEIPLASRIGFCADAFHAIRSDRPYRRAQSAAVALDEVSRNAGSQFDPEVADALAELARHVREKVSAEARTACAQRLVALLT